MAIESLSNIQYKKSKNKHFFKYYKMLRFTHFCGNILAKKSCCTEIYRLLGLWKFDGNFDGNLMGHLMMDSKGWPYDSFDCLSSYLGLHGQGIARLLGLLARSDLKT